jgi:DNA-binding beta-propeller fold protein YncE
MNDVYQLPYASHSPRIRSSKFQWFLLTALSGVTYRLLLLLVLLASSFLPSATVSAQSAGLVGTYNTGLGGNGAEIIAVRDQWGVLTNAGDGSVDILNLANLPNITLIRRLKVPQLQGLTSVAIHPYQDYFIAVAGSAKPAAAPVNGTASFFRLSDGALLKTVTVGIQPDSIAISPDGGYAVIANEAEGFAVGDNGGNGSLTLLHLDNFYPGYSNTVYVYQIGIPSLAGYANLSSGRTDDLARLPIDNTPGTLEPEFVTFSPDSQYAYITLQENNAIIRINLWYCTMSLLGLGQTTHAFDLVVDGQFLPNQTAAFFREPDSVDVVYANSRHYLVTADEGDTRDSAGNSGPRGGRTVSIYSAGSGAFVADTGNQIDALAAARGIYPDGRSNRGGAEPEGIDGIRFNGRSIVAVGLERANAVAFVDITTPWAPVVYDLVSVGANPEGVKLVVWGSALYALTANEGDGTLSVVLVPGTGIIAAGAEAVEETGADMTIESMPDFVADDITPEVSKNVDETTARNLYYLPMVKQ